MCVCVCVCVCGQAVIIQARFRLADDVTAGMPGPRAGSSWFQPRGGSTTAGLRSTGAVRHGARRLIQPVSDYRPHPSPRRRHRGTLPPLARVLGAVWCHLASPSTPSTMIWEEDAPVWIFRWPSPPLSSIEALRRRAAAADTGAAAPRRLLPLPHFHLPCSLEKHTGAPTACQPPVSDRLFFFLINQDRGRCPSLCHPGLYYGGVSISQSLLASHPLSGAFGYHQCCHRPRGTGNGSCLVFFSPLSRFSAGQQQDLSALSLLAAG